MRIEQSMIFIIFLQYKYSIPSRAMLNLLDLRSIVGCLGGREHHSIYTRSVFTCAFRGNFS